MLDEKWNVGIFHAIDRLAGRLKAGTLHEGEGGCGVGDARDGGEADATAGGLDPSRFTADV